MDGLTNFAAVSTQMGQVIGRTIMNLETTARKKAYLNDADFALNLKNDVCILVFSRVRHDTRTLASVESENRLRCCC